MQSTLDDFKSTLDHALLQLRKITDSDSQKVPSPGNGPRSKFWDI